MTIDEKLEHFYEISLEEAKQDAEKAIQEHKEHLAQMLEEHKTSRRQSAEAEVKAEAEHVRREVNKALSAEQITLKRDWSRKQEELKDDLFAEIRLKVKDAGEDEVEISLSPEDSDKAEEVSRKTGVPLEISGESFLGGIRAAIPHKNILIDNSFQEGLETMRREFKFDGGLKHE